MTETIMRRGRWEPDDEPDIDKWDRDDYDEVSWESWECPYCGEEMYDDSPRCPHCGNYLSREDEPGHKPRWVLLTAVILLVLILSGLTVLF